MSQEIVLFNDTIAANIAYGAMAGAPQRGDRARGRGGERARLHPRAAAGLRHGRRRARHPPVRRPAAAHRDRARDPQGRADPDPRRGDLGARHRVGAPDPGGARRADARPHDDRDRAPAVDDRALRPHRRARRRAHRRAGHARRAARARRASTRGCTRGSSATTDAAASCGVRALPREREDTLVKRDKTGDLLLTAPSSYACARAPERRCTLPSDYNASVSRRNPDVARV